MEDIGAGGEMSRLNIQTLSQIISKKWNTPTDLIINHIFTNISVGIARNTEMKKDINKIFDADKLKYYDVAVNSKCIDHIILSEGTLETQIYARRVLGVFMQAEEDNNIRSKLIKLLRKHYPIIYNAVKKKDKEKLKNKYMKMDIINRNVEARFDSAIYFYFATYISAGEVDQGFIISILKDIEDFEFGNLINQNIEDELEKYKDEISEIKALLKREYKQINNYKDVIRHNNQHIRNYGNFLEDVFSTNQFNINNIFSASEFINIDKLILSHVRTSKNRNLEVIISHIISGIFVQSIINEYKSARNLYFKNSGETLYYELDSLQKRLYNIQEENNVLKAEIENLNKEKSIYNKNLNCELSKLDNTHKRQIKVMEDKIKNLENKLNEEKNLRFQLESLREYELNKEVITGTDSEICLEDYINDKKIIIIGGDKEWRRRFRVRYPEIRTLNGFNENFDISILNDANFILFYTKYMNHSTFHKTMNFIKLNQIRFGYIGKTNMELVEEEIIDIMRKYEK